MRTTHDGGGCPGQRRVVPPTPVLRLRPGVGVVEVASRLLLLLLLAVQVLADDVEVVPPALLRLALPLHVPHVALECSGMFWNILCWNEGSSQCPSLPTTQLCHVVTVIKFLSELTQLQSLKTVGRCLKALLKGLNSVVVRVFVIIICKTQVAFIFVP